VRSFVRGRPESVDVYLRQFYNPKAFPQLKYEFESFAENAGKTCEFPPSSLMSVVHFKPGLSNKFGDFAPSGKISTDSNGRGWLTIRGAKSGTAKVLLTVNPDQLVDDTLIAYDNDDNLNFWAGAGFFAVRVLSDDWYLEDIPTESVDFDLIYKHVLAFYEFSFSFMKVDVFNYANFHGYSHYSSRKK
jgi:chromopyrrolic acid synthase